jgi:hypothetical protein
MAEGPDFIALDALAGQIAESAVLVLLARWPYLRHEALNGVLGHASHANRCADRIALD